jgi:hypothetical protein
MCGFKVADSCQAAGTCFAAPAPGTPQCNAFAPGCACDGSTVNLACNGYPSGYASRPVLHSGVCNGGGDAGAGGPCVQTSDCPSGYACGFPVDGGCTAQGTCFPNPVGPICQAYSPGCTCSNQTISIVCNGFPSGYAGSPIQHRGTCEGFDAGNGMFACGPLSCHSSIEVCKIGVGGPQGAPPSYACIGYPTQCAADRTCACVQPAVGSQVCSEANGDFTVTFEYP